MATLTGRLERFMTWLHAGPEAGPARRPTSSAVPRPPIHSQGPASPPPAPLALESDTGGQESPVAEAMAPAPVVAFAARRQEEPFPRRSQEEAARLERVTGEFVHLMQAFSQHLESQSQRSQRTLEVVERLPAALERQAAVLEAFHQNLAGQQETHAAFAAHLQQQASSNDRVGVALVDLARTTETSEQAITLVGGQLGAQQANNQRMLEAFGAVVQSLNMMSDSTAVQGDALADLSRQHRESQDLVRQMLVRSERQNMMFAAVSWTLALIALGVAAFVGVSAAKLAAGAVAAAAPVAAPVAVPQMSSQGAPRPAASAGTPVAAAQAVAVAGAVVAQAPDGTVEIAPADPAAQD